MSLKYHSWQGSKPQRGKNENSLFVTGEVGLSDRDKTSRESEIMVQFPYAFKHNRPLREKVTT